MKLNIKAVNFDMAGQLEKFIEKKTERFGRHLQADDEVEVKMTVVKPATNMNKETQVRIGSLFAEKTCDTFEEGLSECFDALVSQLEKRKNN
ncbi:MAG: HPF/RaiA family ribosome-associated protein [Paludibacteraceae bacterium]|nr:HPF/RaiA family ribosome-associated protein [Paludibacteraceae bacterium]